MGRARQHHGRPPRRRGKRSKSANPNLSGNRPHRTGRHTDLLICRVCCGMVYGAGWIRSRCPRPAGFAGSAGSPSQGRRRSLPSLCQERGSAPRFGLRVKPRKPRKAAALQVFSLAGLLRGFAGFRRAAAACPRRRWHDGTRPGGVADTHAHTDPNHRRACVSCVSSVLMAGPSSVRGSMGPRLVHGRLCGSDRPKPGATMQTQKGSDRRSPSTRVCVFTPPKSAAIVPSTPGGFLRDGVLLNHHVSP